MSDTPVPPVDFQALIRTREYQRLLVLSGVTGVVVSLAAWCFLSIVPWLQDTVYLDLPTALGFDTAPTWWPIPVLAVAGLLTAVAITRMHGGGGGVPAEGMSSGITHPEDLPGVLLAALATLGLGLVLGPSSPVIALGMGVALLVLRFVAKDAPEQTQSVVAASGGFASLAMVFSNPIVAAIITIEAMGIGGAMAPVLVLPGLLAAGIGSIIYFGLGQLSGLSTSAYAARAPRSESPRRPDLRPVRLDHGRRHRRIGGRVRRREHRTVGRTTGTQEPSRVGPDRGSRGRPPGHCVRRVDGSDRERHPVLRFACPHAARHGRRDLLVGHLGPAVPLQGAGLERLHGQLPGWSRVPRDASWAPPEAYSHHTCRASPKGPPSPSSWPRWWPPCSACPWHQQ